MVPYNEMNMTRAERVAMQQLQQFPSRAIAWNLVSVGLKRTYTTIEAWLTYRVWCWTKAIEGVLPLIIGVEFAAQVVLLLVRVLLLIKP